MTAPINTATPASPKLIVPIQLSAIYYPSTNDQYEVAWEYTPSNLETTAITEFASVETGMLVNTSSSAAAPVGAVIKWTLPDALTRQDATGAFPVVPDCWLVVRRVIDPTGEQPQLSACVVQSSATGGTSPYIYLDGGAAVGANIGVATEVGQWTGPQTTPLTLTAVGPGMPSYAAFLPNLMNVFAYNDALSGVAADATVTYWVVGWYGDADNDPLNGCTAADFLETLADLDWGVAETTAPNPCPTQTLFHGMSIDMTLTQGSGVPVASNCNIGVGPTTTDALCAALTGIIDSNAVSLTLPEGVTAQQFAQTATTLIQAAQYGLLDRWAAQTADFSTALAKAVHDAGFAPTDGGTLWQLAPATDSPPVAENSVLCQLLASLNQAQAALDLAVAQQNSLAAECYGNWWRLGWLQNNPAATSAPTPHEPSLKSRYAGVAGTAFDTGVSDLETLVALVAANTAAVAAAQSELIASPDCIAGNYTLRSGPGPLFYAPPDPVVVIADVGRQICSSDVAAGNGALPCRLTGDIVTGIAINQGLPFSLTPILLTADALDVVGTIVAQSADALPAEVAALLGEAVLLDPQFASYLAGVAAESSLNVTGMTEEETFAAISGLQNALFDDQPATAAGWIGTPPAPPAPALWQPAWEPLYLDWQISYWDQSAAGDGWTFNAPSGDYAYTGQAPVGNATATLSGRTPLSSTPVLQLQNLIAALEPYGGGSDEVELLSGLLNSIQGLDLMSQRLTGFNAALQAQSQPLRQPIQIPTTGNHPVNAATTAVLENASGNVFDSTLSAFLPQQGGMMALNQLTVADRFGQAVILYLTNGDDKDVANPGSVTFSLPFNWPLATPPNYGGLPPRILQPGRLDFQMVAASDTATPASWNPSANPVCGWLLPNHLDYGLAVFDSAGAVLGEIVTVNATATPSLAWLPPPGTPAAVGAPPSISDPTLFGFVTGLLQASDGPKALSALLSVIDESAWASCAFDSGLSSGMAAVVGCPIALVRARIGISLNGFATVDYGLSSIANQYAATSVGPLAGLSLPVQLGCAAFQDNGILGYFQPPDFSTIFTTHAPQPDLTSTYVVGPAPPVSVAISTTRPQDAPAEQFLDLALLADPRGSLYAVSGTFPVQAPKLPATDVNAAIAAMAVSFAVGPLLTEPATLRIPTPSMGSGWSFTQRPDVTSWTTGIPLAPVDATARLPAAPPVIRQGWLQLADVETPST